MWLSGAEVMMIMSLLQTFMVLRKCFSAKCDEVSEELKL